MADGFEVLTDESGALVLGEQGGIKRVKDEIVHPTYGLERLWMKMVEIEMKLDLLNSKLTDARIS